MNNQKHLVILSIPLQRLIRVLLSPVLKNALQDYAKILVVSPFSDNKSFQQEFKSNKVDFFNLTDPKRLTQPFKLLYTFSEILRCHGYWMRFRNQGMRFSFATRFLYLGKNGNDVKPNLLKQFVFTILAVLGMREKSWRFIDGMIGPSIFNVSELSGIANGFEKVTLIQSASWGFQDRLLGWMARKHKWRTVLMPYTTDQLSINGYLISDFDAVCVQGEMEYDYVPKYHKTSANQVMKLGSPWARYIEETHLRVKDKVRAKKKKKTIMYAGVDSAYFPIESEFYGLELLLEAIKTGEIEDTEIVYRPLALTEEKRKRIDFNFSDIENLSIYYSESSCIGMETLDGYENNFKELNKFVEQISECDLLVMALDTSLCIELAFIGIPSIAYYYDPSGVLARRKRFELFFENGRNPFVPEIPVIFDKNRLVPTAKGLLQDSEKARNQAEITAKQWDYKNADFNKILKKAIGV